MDFAVHIRSSYTTQWGKRISPRRQPAFRDLIQRSDDIKMAFSRAMPKKKERSYFCRINQDDVHHPEAHVSGHSHKFRTTYPTRYKEDQEGPKVGNSCVG